jgi:hypothetical protein
MIAEACLAYVPVVHMLLCLKKYASGNAWFRKICLLSCVQNMLYNDS